MLDKIAFSSTNKIINYTLQLNNEILKNNKTILIFDSNSKLSKLISDWYISNLKWKYNSEIYEFSEDKSEFFKEMLLNLNKNDTVILVQSTNFRMENFRIRILLQQKQIACIEHNHLSYIKEDEYETYLKSIWFDFEKIDLLSKKFKNLIDNWDTLIINSSWAKFKISGWFEDMKRNSWIYDLTSRYATFPAWENFSEAKIFENVNWELYIKSFPGFDFVVRHLDDPFKITIKNSIITDYSKNTPTDFIEVYDKIKQSEGEVMIRELWFGLNPEISFENRLNDVNAFERMQGFHLSLWKKHNIYRKKLDKNTVQRYHIDIFPVVDSILLDWAEIYNQKWFLM